MSGADRLIARVESLAGVNQITPTEQGLEALDERPTLWLPALSALGRARLICEPDWPNQRFMGDSWPELVAWRRQETYAHLLGRLDEQCHWLPGHFPGQPVLPGVVQTHWAALLGQYLLEFSGSFTGLNVLKFQRVFTPGSWFVLELEWLSARRQLQFKFHAEAELFSQGRVSFHHE